MGIRGDKTGKSRNGAELRRRSDRSTPPRKLRRALAGWAGRHVMIPDDKIRWALAAYMTAKRLLKAEGIDVIYSSSPPVSAHLLAMRLKKRS